MNNQLFPRVIEGFNDHLPSTTETMVLDDGTTLTVENVGWLPIGNVKPFDLIGVCRREDFIVAGIDDPTALIDPNKLLLSEVLISDPVNGKIAVKIPKRTVDITEHGGRDYCLGYISVLPGLDSPLHVEGRYNCETGALEHYLGTNNRTNVVAVRYGGIYKVHTVKPVEETSPSILEQVTDLLSSLTYDYHHFPGTHYTICISKDIDGFVYASGVSSALPSTKFDAKIGREVALKDCKLKTEDKVWELLGFNKYHNSK